jgi:hypothetical protein
MKRWSHSVVLRARSQAPVKRVKQSHYDFGHAEPLTGGHDSSPAKILRQFIPAGHFEFLLPL